MLWERLETAPAVPPLPTQGKARPSRISPLHWIWSLKCPHALFQQFHSWHPPYRHHTTSEHQELGSLSFTFTGKRLEMTQVSNHRGPFNVPWGIHMYSAGWGPVKWVQSLHINMMRSPGYIFEWRTQNYRVVLMECVLNIYALFKGNIQTTLYTFLKVHLGACKNIKKKI